MITAEQIRAARGLLDWSQAHLSEICGVARVSIKNIETGLTAPRKDSIEAIAKAFEDHGIEFLPRNGVRQKDDIITVLDGQDAEQKLADDIYNTLLSQTSNKEVLISGLEETDPESKPEVYARARNQVERLQKINAREKILSIEGNTNFISPWYCYRYLPKENFVSAPLFIYGDKIALNNDVKPYKSIVIHHRLFADSCRQLFNFAWERASVPDIKNKNTEQ